MQNSKASDLYIGTQRSGRNATPLLTAERARRRDAAHSAITSLGNNAWNKALSSSRARGTPRQTYGPRPKATCGFGLRSIWNVLAVSWQPASRASGAAAPGRLRRLTCGPIYQRQRNPIVNARTVSFYPGIDYRAPLPASGPRRERGIKPGDTNGAVPQPIFRSRTQFNRRQPQLFADGPDPLPEV